MLRGTIRDAGSGKRRAFVRFFACEEDLSHESPDVPLPDAIASGAEPFMVVGAIAGGRGGGADDAEVALIETARRGPPVQPRTWS